ncbi:hypothetical protein [Staphylothermus hellenicus]|uniref:Uncharacterized protein n=1 Tax=Staphylothermus hellenicus (strain DSM 12710 / JCM 10830 / BK20S6-10-b1 / P8) TaxID=591019 RepID=D7DBW1_STAHD|nr:hypothetical protein [Staphylothermus hellenicus]ADI31658.1 hypothetical protein Shell_0527 [Staphylothermus hellenicus DSM 12710]
MSWYPPPPKWYYAYPPAPIPPYGCYPFYDPEYLTAVMTQYMIYPYYYMLTIEIYRTMLDTWRKTMETFIKSLEQYKTYTKTSES